LIGGETAEMPGLYGQGQWDLAGFCVGIVDKAKIIDGRKCRRGDAVIGLASSGLHSNGYSLARKVFTEKEMRGPLGRVLLRPTRIYSRILRAALAKVDIKAMAHITGGGFYDNIPRVIPERFGVWIRKGSWPVPKIFKTIQERGGVEEREMHRTLNMGIGMAVVVSAADAVRTVRLFEALGQKAWIIGALTSGRHEVVID
jgi:phosphoribosylformylglycinamidine cyclo-ligase